MIKGNTTATKKQTEDNIKFNLRSNPKSKKSEQAKKPVPIYARFRYFNPSANKHIRLHYPTKQSCRPSEWNAIKQRPASTFRYYKTVKDELDRIAEKIISIYDSNTSITLADFKDRLDRSLGRKIKDGPDPYDSSTFIGFISDYSQRKKRLSSLSENTIKKYTTVANKLKSYHLATGGGINYNDFDISFVDNYLIWLYDNTGTNSANTANKDFATIKLLLKKSYKEDLHSNTIFTDEEFGVKRVKTIIIALNEKQVQLISDCDLNEHVEELKKEKITLEFADKVKDWFLVACYSSLRWSDFTSIEPENIINKGEDYFIKIETQKGKKEVTIPINKKLFELLAKYNNTAPVMSSQKFNDTIKVICRLAGLTQSVDVSVHDKGKVNKDKLPLYSKISAHSGRRTWASINYHKGFPMLLLMACTGHSKESTFLSYIGVSSEDKADRLMKLMKKDEADIVSNQPKLKAV